MGIKDLLRFLKPHIEPINIKKYAGKRVGIDAYSWLHKGAYSCSMELCLNLVGDKKTQFLSYFMHRINLLRFHKIIPVVVFDGGSIPCKAATENDRYRRRKANRELAMTKLKEGDVNSASELFQRAVSITPAMAHQLIQVLRSENIEYVVAPYEADAQLAYLASLDSEKGGVVAVITEDSDLIAYSCPSIMFKMDRYGNGEELLLKKIFDSAAKKPSFKHFDKELFIGMCVLAGCDFLPSVPGIGIAKAYSLVSKYRNLERVLSVLKIEKGSQMPEDYSKSFREAIAVFQHARIYDADTKMLKHLKPLTEDLLLLDGELDFLGPEIPPSVASAIAKGNVDPTNMVAFDCSPTSVYHADPAINQPSGRMEEPETAVLSLSRRESPSLVFSSDKTSEKDAIGTERGQDPVSTGRQHFNDAGLERLILSAKVKETKESATVFYDTPLNIPNNNPFKKRKLDELDITGIKDVTEQTSDKNNNEQFEILCVSPDEAQLSKRKQNEISFSQGESFSEQISLVTEVESSEVLCFNTESQESVNSKPKRVSNGSGRGKKGLKKDNIKSSQTKNTILNFFSRV
ncbi:hypothetical protein SLE2022_346200 [Rubroshorea leprosula]